MGRAIMGRALVGAPPGPYGPGPYGLGPYGLPWVLMGQVLMGRALMGPLGSYGPGIYGPRPCAPPLGSMGPAPALVGWALMGAPGPLWAGPLWAAPLWPRRTFMGPMLNLMNSVDFHWNCINIHPGRLRYNLLEQPKGNNNRCPSFSPTLPSKGPSTHMPRRVSRMV